MSEPATIIIGGGATGLWLCDALRRRGDPVLLLEAAALGTGQTVGSQGIIHGGTKYALDGEATASAARIRDMPARWRACLAGRTEPDLSSAPVLADFCHLWQTHALRSRLGMLGARVGLRVAPTVLGPTERPTALRQCPGTVARLDEQVVDVAAFLAALAERNADHLLAVPGPDGVRFEVDVSGAVTAVVVAGDPGLHLPVGTVVLAAGQGNAELRRRAHLDPSAMQRRPLHMVLVRGTLPVLHGHCVDGAATRATITTVRDRVGRTVWQVGGQVAESGVAMDPATLVAHAHRELRAILPGVDLDGLEWATYRVDRAERAEPDGRRPADAQAMVEWNVVTTWPTKLALVPQLVDQVLDLVPARRGPPPPVPAGWPRPPVALPPWETEDAWIVVP